MSTKQLKTIYIFYRINQHMKNNVKQKRFFSKLPVKQLLIKSVLYYVSSCAWEQESQEFQIESANDLV